MKTPIVDFAHTYAKKRPIRMHMPGHKGIGTPGLEEYDLTEIEGADELFAPTGIIAESEANASELFGCPTCYSTEGSSLCVKAMLTLTVWETGESKPLILAARNVHKSFLDAAVLLDFEISWLYGSAGNSYLGCETDAGEAEQAILNAPRKPAAVYLTSPDYLGNLADVKGIAKVCKRHGILLLVDNAHGAYLKFLTPSLHPIDLGADLVCSSAHKTLPVLTGGAYLHLSPAQKDLLPRAKEALALFGSTSPSYLILQSLDAANPTLTGLEARLTEFLPTVQTWKGSIRAAGYETIGSEPLKCTLDAKKYGYDGAELAAILREQNVFCEFCDEDFVVLMLSPAQRPDELDRVRDALCSIPKRTQKPTEPVPAIRPVRVLSPREAAFGRSEEKPLADCAGRIFAGLCVSCPPAVTPIVCGEKIDRETIRVLARCGVTKCRVLIEE